MFIDNVSICMYTVRVIWAYKHFINAFYKIYITILMKSFIPANYPIYCNFEVYPATICAFTEDATRNKQWFALEAAESDVTYASGRDGINI